jgi:hypothetical protein
MSVAGELYGGDDQAVLQALLGENARQGTGWLYVQEQGDGLVSFVGAAREQPARPHPLRYGSDRTHQFVLGQVILRPSLVIATDTLRGRGLSGLTTGPHDLKGMLADGEILIATDPVLRKLRQAGEI